MGLTVLDAGIVIAALDASDAPHGASLQALREREVAREAAALRARHGRALRLSDALILATATVAGADQVLTTDARWPDTGAPRIVGAASR